MPSDTRSNYDLVKQALLELHNFQRSYYRQQWSGRHFKDKTDMLYQRVANELKCTLLAWKKLESNTLDWMWREQFLQVIHPEVRSYVLLQDPSTAKEAYEVAERYHSQNPHLPRFNPHLDNPGPRGTRRQDDRSSNTSATGGKSKEGSYRRFRSDNRQGPVAQPSFQQKRAPAVLFVQRTRPHAEVLPQHQGVQPAHHRHARASTDNLPWHDLWSPGEKNLHRLGSKSIHGGPKVDACKPPGARTGLHHRSIWQRHPKAKESRLETA